jgi:hypothetical protein
VFDVGMRNRRIVEASAGSMELEGACPPSGSMLNSVSGTNKVMPKVNSSLRTEYHQHKYDTAIRLLLNIKQGSQDKMCHYEIREIKHGIRDIDFTTVGHNYIPTLRRALTCI